VVQASSLRLVVQASSLRLVVRASSLRLMVQASSPQLWHRGCVNQFSDTHPNNDLNLWHSRPGCVFVTVWGHNRVGNTTEGGRGTRKRVFLSEN